MADADDEDGEDGEDGNAVNDDGTTAGTLLVEGCEGGGGRIAPSMGSISTTTTTRRARRPSERRNDDGKRNPQAALLHERQGSSIDFREQAATMGRERERAQESERKRAGGKARNERCARW